MCLCVCAYRCFPNNCGGATHAVGAAVAAQIDVAAAVGAVAVIAVAVAVVAVAVVVVAVAVVIAANVVVAVVVNAAVITVAVVAVTVVAAVNVVVAVVVAAVAVACAEGEHTTTSLLSSAVARNSIFHATSITMMISSSSFLATDEQTCQIDCLYRGVCYSYQCTTNRAGFSDIT